MARDDRMRVGMLGPLEVSTGQRGLGLRDFGGRKPRQVLGILLVHQGEPVPKERIADLLWADRPPQDPMRTLEAYVSVLRARLRALAPTAALPLRSEPGAYRFSVSEVGLDLRELDDLCARAARAPASQRLALRRRALALVRGELLADEPYAEWAMPLRELYAERHARLLLDAAEDALAAGSAEEAAGYAERVLAAQPTRERAHRLLVAARYRAGEPDLALAAYQRCRTVLDQELGVRPLPSTEAVYLAVLRQDPVDRVLPTSREPVTTAPRPPRTRFAAARDATIAYQVVGDGPTDVVFCHAWFSHMEVGWEEPRYAAFLHRLARGRRLLLFDRRGMGMSDPAPAEVTLEERTDDVRAVLDAAESTRAAVVGSCGSGPIAVALTSRFPERVTGLALFGTFPRMLASEDYPYGWTPEFLASYRAGLEMGWQTGRGIARSVPTAGPDEELMEWLGRLLRLSVSPASARAILDFSTSIDVRADLPRIRRPTLVLHRRDDQWVRPENGRYLAEHIPGAMLLLLPGRDHWPWFGDAESVLRPLERFLDDVARPASEGFPRVPAPRSTHDRRYASQ